MSESNFLNNLFNMLGVEYPEHTIKHLQQIAQQTADSLFTFEQFYKDNEIVFTGDINEQMEKYYLTCFNVGAALRKEENAPKHEWTA